MDGQKTAVSQFCKTYVSPNWPYEEWECIERKFEAEDGHSFDDMPTPKDISTKAEVKDSIGSCVTTVDLTAHDTKACETGRQVIRKAEFLDKNEQIAEAALLKPAEDLEDLSLTTGQKISLFVLMTTCHCVNCFGSWNQN